MWDNRLTKRNPRAPDFKCRSRLCDGVIWPPRASVAPAPLESYPESPVKSDDEIWAGAQKAIADDEEELPFR